MVILIAAIPTVVNFVTEAPPVDTLKVVTAELGVLGAVDFLTDFQRFVATVHAVIVTITAPLPGYTQLEHTCHDNRHNVHVMMEGGSGVWDWECTLITGTVHHMEEDLFEPKGKKCCPSPPPIFQGINVVEPVAQHFMFWLMMPTVYSPLSHTE